MGKLYFRYGAMGSSKTANALMVRYNYIERGKKVVLLKPDIENRDGVLEIKSRIGLSAKCELMSSFLKRLEAIEELDADAVIVDECQFLSTEEVDALAGVVDKYDVPVICYGLRTDFQSHLFEGSKRLMEISDVIEEIPTICWCGHRAHCNARISNGKIVKQGEQILMGGNEQYISLCRKHYMNNQLHS